MVDFDTTRAIMLTLTGVGAAFVAIVSLMVVISVNKFVSGRWDQWGGRAEVAAPVGSAPVESPGDGDARMAAAIGVAVALATSETPGKGALQGAHETGGLPFIRGWRSLGRWQGIEATRSWRRPGPGRDPRGMRA